MKKILLLGILLIIVGCSKQEDIKDCEIPNLSNDEYVLSLIDDLVSKVDNNGLAFAYLDVNSNLYYGYHDKDIYYAASTIKLVNALYIYSLARDNKLNLNTYIDNKTVKELVSKMILVSDNEAHLKLIDYLGVDNLRQFGKTLGAVNILVGDKYGKINADEGIIYLKELYNFLKVDDIYSQELYNLFLNADENYNPIEGVNFLHKYGHYGVYFNDLAIYDIENPYLVAYLSKDGYDDYGMKIREFYELLNDFHRKYWEYRENYCH